MSWIKHGYSSRKGKQTRIYRCWQRMRSRCSNPNWVNFRHYGGRGITVCARWADFKNFLDDMGEPPVGWSIERVDNDRGYSPDNCVWAKQAHQLRNRRSNRVLTVRGKTGCLTDLAEFYKIPLSRVRGRLALGWSIESAFFGPKRVNQYV